MSVVESNEVAEIFDLNDYATAKVVCDDFPRILAMTQSLVPALQPYQAYNEVYKILEVLMETDRKMQRQLKRYQEILDNKGRVSAERD